jgi:uncharacterized protein (TIRG00374 family)
MNIKKIVFSIMFGLLVMGGLIWFSGPDKFLGAFSKFSMTSILWVVALSFLNYFLRFIKWHTYLKVLGLEVNYFLSMRVFFSGMLMSISPGKVGEVFKSVLLKSELDIPIMRSAPVVLMERLTDLIAIIFLSMFGFFLADFNLPAILLSIGLVLLFIVVISNQKIAALISSLFGKYSHHVSRVFESLRELAKPLPILITTLLSIASWFMECLGFYILILPFSDKVSILEATYIYAICTLLGALSMLPGGLAATEVGMTYFLVEKGLNSGVSGAITFMIRLLTLWFAIFLAFIFFFGTFEVKKIFTLIKNGKRKSNEE